MLNKVKLNHLPEHCGISRAETGNVNLGADGAGCIGSACHYSAMSLIFTVLGNNWQQLKRRLLLMPGDRDLNSAKFQ
jgi:hypothetical protein